MTIDLNRLRAMKKEELIEVARQVNAVYHVNNKAETIVDSIINKVMEQTLTTPKDKQHEIPKVKEPIFLTEQQVEVALAALKERNRAFSTIYNTEDNCITLRYNDGRYKHAETINLSCSLTKLVRKANEIVKGPLVPRSLKTEEWSHLGGNEKNKYTEVVLAG